MTCTDKCAEPITASEARSAASGSALDLDAELRRCHPASHGWALACCRWDRAEAEDTLNDAYLKILDGRARYAGRASFQSFLYGVIRRTAAERRRRDVRRRLAWLRRGAASPEPAWDESGSALDHERLRRALCTLPARQREVLHLVFYSDLSIREAAVAMGVSLGSARQHYERGKRRLREHLGAGETR